MASGLTPVTPNGDDDVTIGELSRSLTALRAELSLWRTELSATLSTHVSLQLYQSEMHALTHRLASTEDRLEKIEDERDRVRMAVFTAIVAPIVVAVIVGVFLLRGGH